QLAPPWNPHAVVAEVSVVVLVVVDSSRVLRPQLCLVKPKVRGSEESCGHVDQVGVERQPVEVPRRPRTPVESGELAEAVALVLCRIGEVVLWLREQQPER